MEELVRTGESTSFFLHLQLWLDSQRCEKERARVVKARAQRRSVGWIYTTDKFLPKVHQTCKIAPPRYIDRIDDMRLGISFAPSSGLSPEHGWAWGWKSSSPLTNNREAFYMQSCIPGNVPQLQSTLVEQDSAWCSTASRHVLDSCKITLRLSPSWQVSCCSQSKRVLLHHTQIHVSFAFDRASMTTATLPRAREKMEKARVLSRMWLGRMALVLIHSRKVSWR